jgi:hypothetical protein
MTSLSPRQQDVLNLLNNKKGTVTIRGIQEEIGASQATAYREAQALIQHGLAVKIPGGIRKLETTSDRCLQCHGEVNIRLAVLIENEKGAQSKGCCPHCALMALHDSSNVRTSMTPDFIYGTMLNTRQAWYVIHKDMAICCRPAVLSFAREEDARSFAKGFGGEVVDFSSAQNRIRDVMKF